MNKEKLYNKLCDEADEILIKSGVRQICISCSTSNDKDPSRGCCQYCTHLSPEGCTIKALWCKIWFCWSGGGKCNGYDSIRGAWALKLIEEAGYTKKWNSIKRRAEKYNFLKARGNPFLCTHQYCDDDAKCTNCGEQQ